jgi:flavin reductase (DIM6/NTAB) family NADH-FMN oxidoreductase RutF
MSHQTDSLPKADGLRGFRTADPFELDANFFHEIGRQWMLVTAARPCGSVNSMTAAWGGVGFIWQQPTAFFFIRPQRFTKTFVEAASTLSLSFFDSSVHRDALTFMGNVSGYEDAHKVEHSGLTLAFCETEVVQEPPLGASRVERTPYFSEARLVLVCERLYQQEMRAECFLDKEQLERFYGRLEGENDLHTLYIAGIRQALVRA